MQLLTDEDKKQLALFLCLGAMHLGLRAEAEIEELAIKLDISKELEETRNEIAKGDWRNFKL